MKSTAGKVQINNPDVMDYADLCRNGGTQTRSMPGYAGPATQVPASGTRSAKETDAPHVGGMRTKRGSVARVTKVNRESGY